MPVFFRISSLLTLLTLASGVAHAQTTASSPTPASTALAGPLSAERLATLDGSVVVQRGDTAYSLARAHGLTVEALLALNGLGNPALKVGQVLRVREVPPYVVQRGDTLYSLARRFGVTVDGLLAANTLPPGVILEVGQVLRVPVFPQAPASPVPVQAAASPVPGPAAVPVPAPAPVAAVVPDPALPADWRGAALALVGVPYVYGGNSTSGLDCSGLIMQVFVPLGVQLPRRSADQAQAGLPVALSELQPGDLVFFDTEGRGAVTHAGIYLGDDQFVSANSYRGQVSVDRLQADAYWRPKLIGARRVLASNVYAAH